MPNWGHTSNLLVVAVYKVLVVCHGYCVQESTQRSRREPPKGFITRSESYINASAASRWEIDACCGDEASPVKDPSAPVFDRSRFVQEVQLDGMLLHGHRGVVEKTCDL